MKRATFFDLNILFYLVLSIMLLGVGVILEKVLFQYTVYFTIPNIIYSLLFFIINYSGVLFLFRDKNELRIKDKIIYKGEVLGIAICSSVIITVLQFSRLSITISGVLVNEILLLIITPIIILLFRRKRTNSKA